MNAWLCLIFRKELYYDVRIDRKNKILYEQYQFKELLNMGI